MSQLLLMCMIAGRRAGIPAQAVQSVIEIEDITPIPRTPPFIEGLTALRSQALTVISCTRALGLDDDREARGRRAAVVDIAGHLYALMVDEAFDVAMPLSDPATIPGGFGPGWEAVAQHMVETEGGPALVIDIEALVRGPQQARAA